MRFRDFLAEEMKDPEFAAEYERVSAEENAKLEAIMKKEPPTKIQLKEGLCVEFTNPAGRTILRLEARLEEDILTIDALETDGVNHTTLVLSPAHLDYWDEGRA